MKIGSIKGSKMIDKETEDKNVELLNRMVYYLADVTFHLSCCKHFLKVP